MTKRVFFSFHYDDIWRANQVRNSWVVRGEREPAGFIDHADFETVERQGRGAIQAWIDSQLNGTSTTIVLIGQQTAEREYVRYEILQSYRRGNGLLGITIHGIKDFNGQRQWWAGPSPFDKVEVEPGLFWNIALSSKLNVPIYDWVDDHGRENISRWIDNAPRKAD